MTIDYNETINPALTGFKGRCPRCQRGHLFNGLLSLAPSCEVCGLDYAFADPADGPAFFAMTIVAPTDVRAAALGTSHFDSAFDRSSVRCVVEAFERLAGVLSILS